MRSWLIKVAIAALLIWNLTATTVAVTMQIRISKLEETNLTLAKNQSRISDYLYRSVIYQWNAIKFDLERVEMYDLIAERFTIFDAQTKQVEETKKVCGSFNDD